MCIFAFRNPGVIIKNFTTIDNPSNSPETSLLGNQNAAGVINQYKDIIRDQDHKIQNLQITVKMTHEELERLKKQLADVIQSNSQLYDQNILLKAQLAAATNGNVTIQNGQSNGNGTASEREFYKFENNRLNEEVKSLNEKLNEALEMTEQSLNLTEIGKMRKDQEDLLELLTDQVNEQFYFRIAVKQVLMDFNCHFRKQK